MTPLPIGESRAEETGPANGWCEDSATLIAQRSLYLASSDEGVNALATVGDCHDPSVVRAKASQSPSRGAW